MNFWTRFGLAGTALAAVFGCFVLTGHGSHSGEEKVLAKQVDTIAAALAKNDMSTANAAATKLADTQEEVYDVMLLMKPRDKKGFGVGKVPNAIVPDGIENLIRVMARDQMSKDKLTEHKDDLTEMGRRMAAIGLFASKMAPKKDVGQKTKAKWNEFVKEMRGASAGFTAAVETTSPASVKTASDKLNNTCNACHSVFR